MMAKLFSRPTICLLIFLAAPVFAGVAPGDAIGTFDISRFEVEGNTLLNASAVQSLLASFAGKNRDFGYVERAIDTLQDAYRKHGFRRLSASGGEHQAFRYRGIVSV
jgi:hypothetical protein